MSKQANANQGTQISLNGVKKKVDRVPRMRDGIEHGLSVVMPGQDDESARPGQLDPNIIGKAITDTVSSRRNVRRIQQLIWPSSDTFQVVLCPELKTYEGGRDYQKELGQLNQRLDLPAGYGVQYVSVDLSMLNRVPPHTSRLLLRQDQSITNQNFAGNPASTLLKDLHAQREPFIYQSLVEEHSDANKVMLSVRLAVFDPEHRWMRRKGFARHVDGDDHPWDLEHYFRETNVTSNHNLNTSYHWEVEYANNGPEGPSYSVQYSDYVTNDDYRHKETVDEADQLKRIVTGHSEWTRFRRGDSGSGYALGETRNWNLYGRFVAYDRQVEKFVGFQPFYYGTSPWNRITAASEPEIVIHHVESQADGTHHGVSDEQDYESVEQQHTPQTKGSLDHEGWLHFLIDRAEESGDTAEEETQEDGVTKPDGRLETDDGLIHTTGHNITDDFVDSGILPPSSETDVEVVHLESEYQNDWDAIYRNCAKAAVKNRMVIFIIPPHKDGQKFLKGLTYPIKGVDEEHGARFYTAGRIGQLGDGEGVPVLPGAGTESVWHGTPAATKRCVHDGEIVAEGPIDADAADLRYHLPHLFKLPDDADHNYVVKHPEDDAPDEYFENDPTNDDVGPQKYTILRYPRVPVELSYLERSLVVQSTGDGRNELRVVQPKPDEWTSTGATDPGEFVREFATTYGMHWEGDDDKTLQLGKQAFRQRLLRLYRRQTDREEPSETQVGIQFPNNEDEDEDEPLEAVDDNNDTDPYRPFYEDYGWVFIPAVSADSGLEGESPSPISDDDPYWGSLRDT